MRNEIGGRNPLFILENATLHLVHLLNIKINRGYYTIYWCFGTFVRIFIWTKGESGSVPNLRFATGYWLLAFCSCHGWGCFPVGGVPQRRPCCCIAKARPHASNHFRDRAGESRGYLITPHAHTPHT